MSTFPTSRLLSALIVSFAFGCASHRASEPAPQLPNAALAPLEAFDPGGVGSLETRAVSGDPSRLALTSVHVSAQQRGDMAEVEATHTFHNDGQSVLEGTFRFPMPDGALLTGLAMLIDGKLMEGELVEREKARRTYEAIVDGMQDPALLEWEHGSVFKMRVFPIEPQRDKVVTIRYLTPLRRTADGLEFVQAARTAAGAGDLPALSIDWQGQRVFDEKRVATDRVVSVPAKPASAVLREKRSDGYYSVLRVSPDWKQLALSPKPVAKNWFIVVDTSRSALEELPRALEALRVVLAALPPGARFRMLTSDLEIKAAPQGLSLVTPQAIEDAVHFVQTVTPDGASDLGRAFEVVGGLAKTTPDSALLYLGDCEPTWGATSMAELSPLLLQNLPHTPFFPLMFGASVNDDLAAELAQASGGRRARIRRREDLDAFAKTLPKGVATLDGIEVKAAPGSEVLSGGPLSIEQGRELLLLVKAPADRDPLQGLSVKAKVNGAAIDLTPRVPAQDTGGVARRFGAAFVKKLEKDGRPAPDIVRASLGYGVMSKLTSFLVLESEEAYARFAIERKQQPLADGPRVTGANLENSDGADISADRIQPGDPEILVDAERDALSVKVEFPFGETKIASFDSDARGGRGGWLVRFLVARDTAEGQYEAKALIVHADGSLETRPVRYTVDNTAPELDVRLTPSRRHPGLTEVSVMQPSQGKLSDLKRVELRTPQGSVYQLTAIRWGTFRALIPARELKHGNLRVVGFDQALNHTLKELALP
jgi:vault protein inter-alpha-trypsin-like protein/VWA domain-containing protein